LIRVWLNILDNYGTQVLVKDVDKRYTYLVENDEMSTLLKLKLAKCLEEHCVRTRKNFDDLYAQWDNYSDDDGEPGELPKPVEDPSELYPMTCQDALYL
jgi:hypothetical protein